MSVSRLGPWPLHQVEVCASTNDLAASLAGQGREIAVLATRQTAGRGRLGRGWKGLDGNLFLSVLLRRHDDDQPGGQVALVAGLAVRDALAPLLAGGVPSLKWPNDVLLDGAKLAGVLVEREGEFWVVGIGVNVAAAPEGLDRPVTCLARHGCAADATHVAEAVCVALSDRLARWRRDGFGPIRAAWLDAAAGLGEAVTVSGPRPRVGRFVGLDPGGALLLDEGDGTPRPVHAGEIGLEVEGSGAGHAAGH